MYNVILKAYMVSIEWSLFRDNYGRNVRNMISVRIPYSAWIQCLETRRMYVAKILSLTEYMQFFCNLS